MAFQQLIHEDEHMNFTVNRMLTYGEKAVKLSEVSEVVPAIKDYDSWFNAWYGLAKKADKQGRFLHAAYYYRLSEFYLTMEDSKKKELYQKSRDNFDKAIAENKIERHEIPYQNTFLPALCIDPSPTSSPKIRTIIMHGGYDSFMEEFLLVLPEFSDHGYRVILFEGPGQGQALKNGLKFTHEWEKPVKAVLDHFKVEDVAIVGISWGGFLAPRAASFENRIKQVIAYDVFFDGLEVLTNPMPTPIKQLFRFLVRINAKGMINNLMAKLRKKHMLIDWAVNHGMYITGVGTPFEFYKKASNHRFKDIAANISQDVLLLAGEKDHLIPNDHLAKCEKELTHAKSITTRMFLEKEGGEQHCQVGNYQLATNEILSWLNSFDQ